LLLKSDKHVRKDEAPESLSGGVVSPDLSEERLVEAARALRDDAWAEIYRRHAAQIYE
jgi:hypothetical protein